MEKILLTTDILIIGGGTAGCYAAVTAARKAPGTKILVAEKANIQRSGCLAAGVNALNAWLGDGQTPQDYLSFVRWDAEETRRTNILQINNRLQEAERVGYFDIDLPTLSGANAKLSDAMGAKVVMLYFWATTDEQKLFNMDTLVPIYNEFHGRGFEIYAVSLDIDKSAWASVVKAQQLPWVNVCDTRGNQSPFISLYGLSTLPTAFFLVDGDMDPNAAVQDAAGMRRYLQAKLR